MNALAGAGYRESANGRTRWIVEQRGPRNPVDPEKPYAFFLEQEPCADGSVADVATIFLTNRECPWKCVMCDLWRNTVEEKVPRGAIVRQIHYALDRLPRASVLKLYNSGSFFDPEAIPEDDYQEIAALCNGFNQLIVECHPRLISNRIRNFARLLAPALEVAMGLETVEPRSLELLNKKITVEQFARAAEFLRREGITLRSFLLVHPPFISPSEQEGWLRRSVDFAFNCGSSAVSLIPTRKGNGAMERLEAAGEFCEPELSELEEATDYALSQGRGRVFADLWDLERFSRCDACFENRKKRLARMNLSQTIEPRVLCHLHG